MRHFMPATIPDHLRDRLSDIDVVRLSIETIGRALITGTHNQTAKSTGSSHPALSVRQIPGASPFCVTCPFIAQRTCEFRSAEQL